nr:helix-turn-helix domain-containing protein [Pseudonocardia acidicola]
MRQISTSARIVCNARAGAVLTRGGSALPLPNLPTHAVLRSGSPVLDVVAARVARGAAYTTFLCPVPAGHVRVTALACPDQAPYHLIAAVLVSPAGDLHGLSPGALDILGLLVESWPRRRIAAALGVAEFVVAANIEHIVARLGTGNVALAVLRANREGLYVPRRLVTGRREANGLQSPPPEIPRSHPVDRTLDAIHAHPERRYTLAELAEIAHLSVRRLQDMFRHRTGTSPMRYLETVRLRHAHDDLRRADPATETVSRIAVRNGFPHLGRFAAVYRANYGVPPSETLRAAPGAGPAPGTGSPAPQPLAWLSHPVPTETGWDDMAAVEHPG